jgi:hypothetical protein
LRVREIAVGHAPGAVADEDLAYAVKPDEGCGHATGVERCEVGYIIKNAAKDD